MSHKACFNEYRLSNADLYINFVCEKYFINNFPKQIKVNSNALKSPVGCNFVETIV